MSGSLLTREAILAAALPYKDVHVPEWGGTVRVRTMTGADREEYERWLAENADEKIAPRQLRERLVALCVVDAEGNRLFSSNGDLARLSATEYRPLSRVAAVAVRQNAMSVAAVDALAKNSEGDRSADSTSGSPNDSA